MTHLLPTATVGGTAPYLDPAVSVDERVADLLRRMTIEEKAGQLFQTMVEIGDGGALVETSERPGRPGTTELVVERGLTHLNALGAPATAREFALWHNRLQDLARDTRLGIPVTVSTDPRHAFSDNIGSGLPAGPFSQWPETLGLAAIGDAALVEEFADTVRREYLAVGLRTALHPQVDLLTDPRWARGAGTFGEDAALTARLGVAYVHGLQGTGKGTDGADFGAHSVSAMTKHFPGGGPQKDGEDPHFPYGREQVYPGGRFDLHLQPFRDLIAAGTRQMMPYYGMPIGLVLDGETIEEVGFGFNRQILTGLLRERFGFTGVICTDWGLITDVEAFGAPFPARAWGVEHLTPRERVAKVLDAGADQFGGEACPEHVVDLVRAGRIGEARIDESVGRLLREKFLLGLFDERRYVDPDDAARTVGTPERRAAGLRAQSRALTVLTHPASGAAALPLAAGTRVRLDGADPGPRSGLVVTSPGEPAEVTVLRLAAPFEERGPGFDSLFHAGSLDFAPETIAHVREAAARGPVIVVVHLDRPAILGPIVEAADAVLVDFGSSDEAVLAALAGAVPPEGRLPFDLPRSMAAVAAAREDVPFDTADPLFRFGHGLAPGR